MITWYSIAFPCELLLVSSWLSCRLQANICSPFSSRIFTACCSWWCLWLGQLNVSPEIYQGYLADFKASVLFPRPCMHLKNSGRLCFIHQHAWLFLFLEYFRWVISDGFYGSKRLPKCKRDFCLHLKIAALPYCLGGGCVKDEMQVNNS